MSEQGTEMIWTDVSCLSLDDDNCVCGTIALLAATVALSLFLVLVYQIETYRCVYIYIYPDTSSRKSDLLFVLLAGKSLPVFGTRNAPCHIDRNISGPLLLAGAVWMSSQSGG